MEFLKELFGDKAMTYAELEAVAKAQNMKVINLSEGKYVDKEKADRFEREFGETSLKLKDYEEKIKNLSTVSADAEKYKTELANIQKQIQMDKENAEKINREQNLENSINSIIGDKKFINKFTKDAVIREIKDAFEKEENKFRGINEIFESVTKDQEGLFLSDNKLDLGTSVGQVNENSKIDTKQTSVFF